MPRKLVGIGAFARECLAQASRHCAGKKAPEFQACRRAFIAECRRRLSYVG